MPRTVPFTMISRCSPSSVVPRSQSTGPSFGQAPLARRSTSRTVSPGSTVRSCPYRPVPLPPRSSFTQESASTRTTKGELRVTNPPAAPAGAAGGFVTRNSPFVDSGTRYLGAPDVRDQRFQVQPAQQLDCRLAGFPVEADLRVVAPTHGVPMRGNREAGGRAVHRRRAVAGRRPLQLGADATPDIEGAQDRRHAPAEL